MSNVLLVGTHWGDEGKGKIVDVLSENANGCVRFQGGHNAGHTLVINDVKTILHLIPCLLYTSPSPRDATLSRMPSSA